MGSSEKFNVKSWDIAMKNWEPVGREGGMKIQGQIGLDTILTKQNKRCYIFRSRLERNMIITFFVSFFQSKKSNLKEIKMIIFSGTLWIENLKGAHEHEK